MYNPTKTAENIKILCIKNGITIKQLSEITKVGRDLATQVKNGRIINVEYFCRIADALHVSISDIVDNSNPVEL